MFRGLLSIFEIPSAMRALLRNLRLKTLISVNRSEGYFQLQLTVKASSVRYQSGKSLQTVNTRNMSQNARHRGTCPQRAEVHVVPGTTFVYDTAAVHTELSARSHRLYSS